jgi:hypothetical protein
LIAVSICGVVETVMDKPIFKPCVAVFAASN